MGHNHVKPIIIWDMGGIFYRYFTEMLVDVGRDRGWPLNQMPLGPTHWVRDAAYEAMDRGEITEPDYLAVVVEMLTAHSIDLYPPADLDWSNEFRPVTWETIEDLSRAGFRQAVLTNDASKWLGDHWWEAWEKAAFFEAMTDAKTVGTRKPAPEPYLACAKAMNATPAQCLFVDDMHVNCEGAEAICMAAQWFDITNPADSMRRLRSRLGMD